MARAVCVVAACTFAFGCTTTLSDPASRIRWASSQNDVNGCESLGMVEGSSSQTGVANRDNGRKNARNEALETAASRGATHVHWMATNESFVEISITAEAFRCRSSKRIARRDVTEERSDDDVAEEPRRKRRRDDDHVATTNVRTTAEPDTKVEAVPVPPPKSNPSLSLGTCFFVSSTGLALSSLHVVRNAKTVTVVDAKGARATATVLAKDEQLDLVALQVNNEHVPGVLPLAEDEAKLGDRVFTIGFPEVVDLGFDPKLTEGSVSGERGLGLDFLLQTSTPVQPGNSGGALVNEGGRVVGIVALRQNYFSDGAAATNTAFAVKATSIRTAFRSLSIEYGRALKDRKAAIARARDAACMVIATLDEVRAAAPAPPTSDRPADVAADELWRRGSSDYEMARYAHAISTFKRLVHMYPTHNRADDSRYFLGLSYMKINDWERAIASFEALLEKHPDSDLADDALYMAALAVRPLGGCREGRVLLARIRKQYPSSNVVSAANDLDAQLMKDQRDTDKCRLD